MTEGEIKLEPGYDPDQLVDPLEKYAVRYLNRRFEDNFERKFLFLLEITTTYDYVLNDLDYDAKNN